MRVGNEGTRHDSVLGCNVRTGRSERGGEVRDADKDDNDGM